MDKQVFSLEEMSVKEVFDNLKQGIEPVCGNCGVQFHMEMADGRIKVDYDLFKSMILNLVDNSIKADCKDIWITGKAKDGIYRICLEDNGNGIPPKELGRITEAFYMVDKVSDKRHEGWPLDSISVNKTTNKYLVDLTESEAKDNIFIGDYREKITKFLAKSLGLI